MGALRDTEGSFQLQKLHFMEVPICSIFEWILKSGKVCKVGQYYWPDGEGIAWLKAVTSQGFQGANQLNYRVVLTLAVHQNYQGRFLKLQILEQYVFQDKWS